MKERLSLTVIALVQSQRLMLHTICKEIHSSGKKGGSHRAVRLGTTSHAFFSPRWRKLWKSCPGVQGCHPHLLCIEMCPLARDHVMLCRSISRKCWGELGPWFWGWVPVRKWAMTHPGTTLGMTLAVKVTDDEWKLGRKQDLRRHLNVEDDCWSELWLENRSCFKDISKWSGREQKRKMGRKG